MGRPPLPLSRRWRLEFSFLGNRLEPELYVLPHHGVNLLWRFQGVFILSLCMAGNSGTTLV